MTNGLSFKEVRFVIIICQVRSNCHAVRDTFLPLIWQPVFCVEECLTDVESNTSPRRRVLMLLKTQLFSEGASELSAAG